MSTDWSFVAHLIKMWDEHNKPGYRCFYESAQNDGMANCPSEFDTLGDWIESNYPQLVRDAIANRIFGRNLSEPNFRSRKSGNENPVEEFPVDNDGVWEYLDITDIGEEWLVQLDYGETGQVVRAKSVKVKRVPVEATGAPVENEQTEVDHKDVDINQPSLADVRKDIGLMWDLLERVHAMVQDAPVLNLTKQDLTDILTDAMNNHHNYKLRLRAPF